MLLPAALPARAYRQVPDRFCHREVPSIQNLALAKLLDAIATRQRHVPARVRVNREPFARPELLTLVTLRRESQSAAALLGSADPQVSDCCLHREALP